MKKLFPPMFARPETHNIVGGLLYWLFAFLILPGIFTLAVIPVRDVSSEVWMELIYHAINFAVISSFYLSYLKTSFLDVQLYPKKILSTVGICAVVIIILRASVLRILMNTDNYYLTNIAFNTLPTTEMDLLAFPASILFNQPIWGMVYLVFLAPLTVSCMLYGSIFAPICINRPWLAYVAVAILPIIQHLLMVFCLHNPSEQMILFFLHLPVHLIACWSYQKTDTIWTPIGVHMLANLVLSLETMKQIGLF